MATIFHKGENITIFGDGSQTRSFCFIDDLINGFTRLMDASDDITGPVNLGNPREFTIKQLAQLIVKITGTKSDLIFVDLPEDDPLQRCPDIRLALNKLECL